MLKRAERIGRGAAHGGADTTPASTVSGPPIDGAGSTTTHRVDGTTPRVGKVTVGHRSGGAGGRVVAWRFAAVDSAASARILCRVFRREAPVPAGRRYMLVSPLPRRGGLHPPHARQRRRAVRPARAVDRSWTTARPTRRRRSSPSTPRALPVPHGGPARGPRAAERGAGRDRGVLRRAGGSGPRPSSTTSASWTWTSICRRATSSGLMQRMEAEPRLGTCSGKPWFVAPRRPRR